MKRSFDETSSTPEGIDIALHARVCLKYFQLVVNKTSSSSASADNVKEAISLIYEGKHSCRHSWKPSLTIEIFRCDKHVKDTNSIRLLRNLVWKPFK